MCEDAGVSARVLARAAGVDHSHLTRILRGTARPSIETYARIARALGADLVVRAYPNTGPTIRDRHQAPVLEWLLGTAHPRWEPYMEVAVTTPSRGWIDAVLHEARVPLVVATEIESSFRRIEQLVRWSEQKAAALPSWVGWPRLPVPPQISRLVVVRWTRANRAIAAEFGRQLAVAFPAHPDDAMAAISGTATWPGPALLWVRTEGGRVRFAPGR